MEPCRWWSAERSRQVGRARGRLAASEILGLTSPARNFFPASCAVLAVVLMSACYPQSKQQLTCDDVYPPGQVDFGAIEALIAQDQPITSKGCLASTCHSAQTQRAGIRLDTIDLAYEELSTRPEFYYETLASGYMPHDGVPWDDEDLKAFRSWYCAGAFPP
jgi:hypothetical protein